MRFGLWRSCSHIQEFKPDVYGLLLNEKSSTGKLRMGRRGLVGNSSKLHEDFLLWT